MNNIKQVNAVLRITLGIAILFATGCGGGGGGSIDAVPADAAVVAPVVDHSITIGTAMPGLPEDAYVDPAEIIARRGSWAEISSKAGSDCFAHSTNSTAYPQYSQTYLKAKGSPTGAWAMFQFTDIVPEDLPLQVDVAFDPSHLTTELYIGVSDYLRGAWHWTSVDSPVAMNQVNLRHDLQPISDGGKVYVVVCALCPNTAILDSVRLGAIQALNNVQGFSATDATDNNRIHLTWDRLSLADGYLIEYRDLTDGSPEDWTVLSEISGAWNVEFSHAIDGENEAQRFHIYDYRIKATYEGKQSRNWDEDDGQLGFHVDGFEASDGEYEDKIVLTWDPLLDCDGYVLEYKKYWDFEPLITLSDGATATYDCYEAVQNRQTEFRICPIWDGVPASNWTTDVGNSGLVFFEEITGFTATTDQPDFIMLAWDLLPGVDGYQLYYCEDSSESGMGQLLAELDGSTTEFVHSTTHPAELPVQTGVEHKYQLAATRGGLLSHPTASCIGVCGLDELGDVRWFRASKDNKAWVWLSWSSVDYADSYYIEFRNLAGGQPEQWTHLVTEADTAFQHTLVAPQGKQLDFLSFYEYRIKAVMDGVTSTNWASDIGYCGLFEDFEASDGLYPDRINLSWHFKFDIDSYTIEYRNTEGGFPADWEELAVFDDISIREMNHTADFPLGNEAQEGVVYQYRIKATLGGLPEGHGLVNHGYFGVAGRGEWYMSGMDRKHRRQSAFRGPSTNNVAWSGPEWSGSHGGTSGNYVIDDSGNLYIGTTDGIYSMSVDGDYRWSEDFLGQVRSPAMTVNGDILFLGKGRGIYAYNSYGDQLWFFHGDGGYGSIALADDGAIIFGELDGNLTVLNPDGTHRWSNLTEGEIDTTAAIADDGTIYIYSNDGKLYALTPAGSLLWAYHLGEEPHNWRYHSSPAIGADDTIYIGGRDGRIHAINPDGSLQWVVESGSDIVTSPSISSDGTIYAACGEAGVLAVNPNGSIKWDFVVDAEIHSAPAIDLDGNIYFNSYDLNVYSLTSSGNLRWNYETYDILGSETTLGDGVLYSANGGFALDILAFGPDS